MARSCLASLLVLVMGFALVSCGGDSTGITFEEFKAKLEKLRTVNPEKTCECDVCKGTGKGQTTAHRLLVCTKCKGKGEIEVKRRARRLVACTKCKGTGKTRCKCGFCNGTGTGFDGKTPCKDCAQTGWRMGTCPMCNGRGKVSEPYEGKIIVRCSTCRGNGKVDESYEKLGACAYCKGTGRIKYREDPTVAEFTEAFGPPYKKQSVKGIGTIWYYQCNDGMVQLTVHIEEGRVIQWDQPNLY